MFRFLTLAAAFTVLIISLMSVSKYWQYEERGADVAALMRLKVTAEDIEKNIEAAIAEDNPDDARMYLEIGRRFNYYINEADYLPRIEALETPWNEARRSVSGFASGFMTGDGSSGAGVAGAIAADFTVVGDVRDLYDQYEKHQAGQPVNELVVALAGVGVGLTAATVVSTGAVAPVKAGSSALKMASRSGKLTPSFQDLVLKQSKAVFDYDAFLATSRSSEAGFEGLRQAAIKAYNPQAMRALGETAGSVNTIRQATSTAATLDLLRFVENADDLKRLERVSNTYGYHTKGLMRLVGRAALGSVRVLRRSTALLLGLIASFVSGFASLYTLSRWVKIAVN